MNEIKMINLLGIFNPKIPDCNTKTLRLDITFGDFPDELLQGRDIIENLTVENSLKLGKLQKNTTHSFEILKQLKKLKRLELIDLTDTEVLPLIGELTWLEELSLRGFNNLESLDSLQNLVNLKRINLGSIRQPYRYRRPSNSIVMNSSKPPQTAFKKITELQFLRKLVNLVSIRLESFPNLGFIPDLTELEKLEQIELVGIETKQNFGFLSNQIVNPTFKSLKLICCDIGDGKKFYNTYGECLAQVREHCQMLYWMWEAKKEE